jgi:hypothetical protein
VSPLKIKIPVKICVKSQQIHKLFIQFINYTAQQQQNFLVPWFLRLFLGLYGVLIQKNALDRPHQL